MKIQNLFIVKILLVLTTLSLQILTARANTFTWTNTLGGNWSVAANWSPNVVPGQLNVLNSSDDVVITNAGTYTVVLDVGAAPSYWDIHSLTLGAGAGHGVQTLALTNKILYVNPMTVTNGGVLAANTSDFHAAITVANGGQLNSTNGNYFVNPLTIANGGTFTTKGSTIFESGGVLENGGALNISNGVLTLDMTATNSGAMTVSSGAGLTIGNALTLLDPLTNSGTMTIAENTGGAISISNNLSTTRGGIVNLSGATINLDNAKGITGGNNHEFLINQGAINSTGGGYIQSVPGLTNSGTINVSATTLNLDSGLHLESSGSLNVQLNSASDYGKIAVSGNAALNGALNVTLGNGFNPQNGNSFQPVTYSSGHSGNFTSTNLPALVPWQMSYGSSAVTLSVTTRSIVWTNTLGGNWSDPNNWSPNIVPGGAAYGNDDDAQITASGNYTVVLDEGSVSTAYYLHSLTLGAGSGVQALVVTNTWPDVGSMSVNAGGQVNSSGSYWFNNWVTPLAIAGGGVFNSTNDLFNQHVTVNSGGIFTAANTTNGNGWFAIAGALNVSAGAFVLNGATTNSGTMTVSNGASISVNDNLVLSGAGGIVNLPGGTIDISGGNGISGDNGGETLNNQGAIISSGGYILSVPGFDNSGEINLLAGTLNLDSGLQLQSSGSLNSQLNSASDYGKIAISGNAALNGAFGVTLNYAPAAGDSFTPLAYDSYSGNFSSYNLPASGAGQSWQTSLGATALTLQIAETVTWTNTAGGNWSDAANWSPNLVPGQFDDVGITTPGNYTVVMDPATVNIRSLTLGAGSGAQTLAVTNKTFYVNPLTITGGGVLADSRSTFHAAITVENGGQLNSTSGTYFVNPLTIANGGEMTAYGYYVYGATMLHGNVVVNDGGTLTVLPSGGYSEIANDGSLTVADGGLVDIPSGRLFLYGPMTNSGTVNLTGGVSSTDIRIDNNGTANDQGFLLNLPGGTINLNGNSAVIAADYHNDEFINQGTIVNSEASHSISVSDFDNSAGAVTNLSGTFSVGAFTNALAGTFYTTNGTTIQFQGGAASDPLKPGNPLALLGGGHFQFMSGWLDLRDNVISNLDLHGGYLELEPTFQNGAITNLVLDGIILTNSSDIVWAVTNGIFAMTNGAIYGNYVVQNGGQLISTYNGGNPTFHGKLTVQSGGLLAMISSFAQIANDGSLTVDAGGSANINTYLLLYGPITNSGTLNLTGGSSTTEIAIYNNGTATYQGGLWNLAGGTINLNGSQPSTIQTGIGPDDDFINQGSIVKSIYTGNCSINVTGFTNSGAITSQEGTLQLNKITLQPSGSLNVRLNSKTDYGKFSISGATVLTGAFGATLNGTYVPGVGDSFTPLTYGSFTGNFTTTNLPPLVAWQTTYNPTALTLLVTQTGLIPEFTTFASSGGNLIFNGANGAPGNTYWVLAGTNLTQPLANWTPVATNIFDGNGKFSYTNTVDLHQPQQFFIIELQ